MTLENRVDPWGNLNRHPSKLSTRMGNRGVLHNREQEIIRSWKLKAWISCLMSYKGIQRPIFSEGRYSELFFLDEATAFSAGHRPCAECQRNRSQSFKTAWLNANHHSENLKLSEIDQLLHLERIQTNDAEPYFLAIIKELPVGACFELKNQAVMIVAKNVYRSWSFEGYRNFALSDINITVKVLTPRSIVKAFQQGFIPEFHPTAWTNENSL